MTVPSYQDLLQPMLKVLSAEGDEISKSRLVQVLSVELGLTDDDVRRRLPSEGATVLEHKIEWARTHLQMQGLVEGSLDRGLRLTARGWSFAGQNYPEMLRHRFGGSVALPRTAPKHSIPPNCSWVSAIGKRAVRRTRTISCSSCVRSMTSWHLR